MNLENDTKIKTFAYPGIVIERKEEAVDLTSLRPEQRSFYRSQIFEALSGTNGLVTAASALLAIQRRLYRQDELEEAGNFYQLLVHEILAFESRARQLLYNSDTVFLARFFLLVMLEVAIQARTDLKKSWPAWQLLKSFQNSDDPLGHFYFLIEKLARDASLHVEILELIYLILSQGFDVEEVEDSLESKAFKIDKVCDDLYNIIKAARPHQKTLFASEKQTYIQQHLLRHKFSFKKTLYSLGTLIIVSYLFFMGMIHYAIQPLEVHLAKFNKTITFEGKSGI